MPGERSHDVVGGECVHVCLNVGDHRQLRVGKRAENLPWADDKPGDTFTFLCDPVEYRPRVERPYRNEVCQIRRQGDGELRREQVLQCRVGFKLACQRECEVIFSGVCRRDRHLLQQQRRRWGGPAGGVGPGRHPGGEEARRDAAFLQPFASLVSDGARPFEPVWQHLLGKQPRQGDSAAVHQGGDRGRVGVTEIKGADLQISVEQQLVAATKIDQLAGPCPDRGGNLSSALLSERFVTRCAIARGR